MAKPKFKNPGFPGKVKRPVRKLVQPPRERVKSHKDNGGVDPKYGTALTIDDVDAD